MKYETIENPDPLTIAYMTMGFCQAIERMPLEVLERFQENAGGTQSQVLATLLNHAGFLDAVFENHSLAFDSGVFYYDIAEPFGKQYTEALVPPARTDHPPLSQQALSMEDLAVSVLRDITKEALPQEGFDILFGDEAFSNGVQPAMTGESL